METEPSFEDILSAAVTHEVTDAAASEDTADPTSLFAALLGAEDDAPVDDAAPESEATEEAETLALDGDAETMEDEESEIERIRRERDELLQAKRDADARAAQAERENEWREDRATVDRRLGEALAWLESQTRDRYDAREFILQQLPIIVDGYTRDLSEHYRKREAAWEQVARTHGAQTFVQQLAGEYGLSAGEVAKVKRYPPEFMEQAAQDIVEARGRAVAPVAQELSKTKTQLTKTQTALKKQRRMEQITPNGVGRATAAATFADVKSRITPDNADEYSGAIFAAIGLRP